MPSLTKYKKLKQNPDLYLYQELEDLKQEVRALISAEISKQLSTVEIKQTDVSVMKIVEKITRNILTDIKGDKGEKGDTGLTGVKGDTIVGKQGDRGLQGLSGLQGATGKQGLIGLRGKDGKTPIAGIDYQIPKDGKDAIFPMKEFTTFKKEIEELLKEELKKLKKSKQFRAGGISRGGGLDTRKVIFDELVGTGDGATTVYTLDYTPDTNISNVGISVGTARLHITEDFTRSGRTLTFLIAPPSGHKIYVDYIKE